MTLVSSQGKGFTQTFLLKGLCLSLSRHFEHLLFALHEIIHQTKDTHYFEI